MPTQAAYEVNQRRQDEAQMSAGHELVRNLTEPFLPAPQRRIALKAFARVTGWRPSYELEPPDLDSVANGHLVLEQGLVKWTPKTGQLAKRGFGRKLDRVQLL
jgi:hypothetical protein